MSESRHTPGPWDAKRLGEINRSNARLIAAAPELLAALKVARDALQCCYQVVDYPADGTTEQDAAIRSARAAIARAEGGS
jgi:hypothetical protein